MRSGSITLPSVPPSGRAHERPPGVRPVCRQAGTELSARKRRIYKARPCCRWRASSRLLVGARPGRTTPPIRFPPPPPASADKPVLASQRPGVALAKTGFRPRLALARRSASARRHDGALALLLALSLRISFGLTSRLGENLAWGLSPHKFCAMPRTHVAHNLPAKACEAGCSGSG